MIKILLVIFIIAGIFIALIITGNLTYARPNYPVSISSSRILHVAGYMDSYLTRNEALMVTVSFKGTNPNNIESDNYLLVGMFTTGFSGTTDGLDYGYEAALVLYHNGSIYLLSAVYEVCEVWIAYPEPFGCSLFIPYTIILKHDLIPLNINVNDNVTLFMVWGLDNVLRWYYMINGINSTLTLYDTYHPKAGQLHYFAVGTITIGPYNTFVKYFQFGVESKYSIGNYWIARIYRPAFANYTQHCNASGLSTLPTINIKPQSCYDDFPLNLKWKLVDKAVVTQGSNAYLDDTWRWGSSDFKNVFAQSKDLLANTPPYEIAFFYNVNTISEGTSLWH